MTASAASPKTKTLAMRCLNPKTQHLYSLQEADQGSEEEEDDDDYAHYGVPWHGKRPEPL